MVIKEWIGFNVKSVTGIKWRIWNNCRKQCPMSSNSYTKIKRGRKRTLPYIRKHPTSHYTQRSFDLNPELISQEPRSSKWPHGKCTPRPRALLSQHHHHHNQTVTGASELQPRLSDPYLRALFMYLTGSDRAGSCSLKTHGCHIQIQCWHIHL